MRYLCVIIYSVFTFCTYGQGENTDVIKKAEDLFARGKSFRFKNKDSAYYYYRKSYKSFVKQKDWLSSIYALKGVSFTSSYHYDLEIYKQTLQTIDSLIYSKSKHFDTISRIKLIKNHNLVEKANYYSKIRDYKNTRVYATQLKGIIEKIPDSILTAINIRRLCTALEYEAESYKYEGEYTKAEELYNKSLRLISEHLDESFAIPTYRLLGDLYRKKEEYSKSNTYLRKRLDQEIEKGSPSKNRIVKSCFAIADNHVKMNQADSSFYYLDIAYQQLLENDPLTFQYHEKTGKTYFLQGNIEKAIEELNTAIRLLSAEHSDSKRIDIARLFRLKGTVLNEAEKYDQALQSYQKSLSALATNFDSNSFSDNPLPETVQNKVEYLKVLIEKVKTLNATTNFEDALQTAKTGIKVMDEIRLTFENEEDKQFLIETFYPIFDNALAAVYALLQKTGDDSYIDEAFFLSEKSKSTILLQAILNSKAYTFSNIPEKLLEEERQLKASIHYLQKSILKNKKDSTLQDRLLLAKSNYHALIQDLETRFPSYYDLKYNTEVLSLKDFQKGLDEKTTAISYFFGNNTVYAVTILDTQKRLIKIEGSKDQGEQILRYHQQLANPLSSIDSLQQSSTLLYDQLISPLLQDNDDTNVLIIPDGILNYIPFESLYDGNTYLIENYNIAYANSATLWLQQREKEIDATKILAFAPDFSEAYPSLPHTQKEVNNILSYFNGKKYLGGQATLERFTKESAAFSVLHLATHAILDDKQSENSHLIFTPQSTEEKLYVRDIYAMPINASLVSLSACETGIGSLRRGEGMLSLSRAFFYAGAASLTSSKWQINDLPTAEIMGDFYKELSKGKRKDEALRLAKLAFLKKNYDNNYVHPYYWSGFVVIGDTSAITTKTSIWIWIGLGIFMVVIIFLISKKIRTN